jgi:AcrR family transcriptional regulator
MPRGRARTGPDGVDVRSSEKTSKVGRPPVSESAQTRQRILDGARDCFVRLGFDQTTVKDIASAAGITAGAIYYHFESKQDIFVAIYHQLQEVVFGEFERVAAETAGTLLDRLGALLEKAADIHAKDRQLAAFTAISPIEIQRHDDLREMVGSDARTVYRFFERMVREAGGEVDPADRDGVVNMLVAIVTGFAMLGATARSPRIHREAIETFRRVLDGTRLGVPADLAARRP